MKTIILPGYSPKNAEWAGEAERELTAHGLQTTVHKWGHWPPLRQGFEGQASGSFNPNQEVKKIVEEVGGETINPDQIGVNILAKSVGTAIVNRVIGIIPNQINKIILCGIPSTDLSRYRNFAKFPPDKIIVFQNVNDPWATYEEVKKMLNAINPKIKVVKKPRSDHHYPYYKDFINFLS